MCGRGAWEQRTDLYVSGNIRSISYSRLQSKTVRDNWCEWHTLHGRDSSPFPSTPPAPAPAVYRERHRQQHSVWVGRTVARIACSHQPRAVCMWALDKYCFGSDYTRDPLLEMEIKGRSVHPLAEAGGSKEGHTASFRQPRGKLPRLNQTQRGPRCVSLFCWARWKVVSSTIRA